MADEEHVQAVSQGPEEWAQYRDRQPSDFRARLDAASLAGLNLERVDLSGAILADTDLEGVNLRGAVLNQANFDNANLRDSDLGEANLTRATMQEANLDGADLSNATLRGADLMEANLCGTNLSSTDLSGVDLRGAIYDRHTQWPEGFDERELEFRPLRTSALPIYVVLDQSASMATSVRDLNQALAEFLGLLVASPMVAAQVLVSVVGFSNDVNIYLGLTDPRDVDRPPELASSGATFYGPVFDHLASQIPNDIQRYSEQGVDCTRPIVVFFSDGMPCDPTWTAALARLNSSVETDIVAFGTADVDPRILLTVASESGYALRLLDEKSVRSPVTSFLTSIAQSTVYSTAAPRATVDEVPFVLRLDGLQGAIEILGDAK